MKPMNAFIKVLVVTLILVMYGVACGKQATNPVEKSDEALIEEVKDAVLQRFIEHNQFPSNVEDLVAEGYLQEVPELESGKKITIMYNGALTIK